MNMDESIISKVGRNQKNNKMNMNTLTYSEKQNIDDNQTMANTLFKSINSDSVIRRFHIHSKQQGKQDFSTKRDLEIEIRKTSYKLKLKRFRKNTIIPTLPGKENRQEVVCGGGKGINQSQPVRQEGNQQKFNTFEEYLRRKRTKNMHIRSKMKVFGNHITDRAKIEIEKEIGKQILRLEQRNTINIGGFRSKKVSLDAKDPQTQKQSPKLHKMKEFTVCHTILDRLLGLMMENPKHLTLKYEHEELYGKLKSEMLELIINNDQIVNSLKFLNEEMGLLGREAFAFSWGKLQEIRKKRKPFYLLKQQKKDQLMDQIQSTLETLRQLVQTSLKNFGKPEQAFHLQQHWQHRQGNIVTAAEKPRKLNKTQNCLRVTTIQRFRPLGDSVRGFQV